jgi:O-antigen/teichoic acid export membrane protein
LLLTLTLLLVGIGALLGVVLFAAAPLTASAFDVSAALRADALFLIRLIPVLVAFGFLRGLFFAVLAARQRYALITLVTVSVYGAYALGVVASINGGYGLRGLVLCLAAQTVLNVIITVPVACRYLTRRGVRLLHWPELREFLGFSARVQASTLIGLANLQADSLVMGVFLPLRTVGLAAAGSNFATQLRSVPIGALTPMVTALSNAFGARGEVESRGDFERIQRLWVLVSTGWSVVALGVVYFGVTAWLGPGYELSGVVALIAVAGNAVNLWTGVTVSWLSIVGRPGLQVRVGLLIVSVNLVLTLALVVPFGAVGVVSATAVAQIGGSFYLLRLVRGELASVPSFFSEVPVVAAVVGGFVTVACELLVRPVVPEGPAGLFLCGLAGLPGLAVYILMSGGAAGLRGALRSDRLSVS